ncbi:hypothetical protein AAKU55_004064 [Oxalobacteraceae bacterium GrIS 1.11]
MAFDALAEVLLRAVGNAVVEIVLIGIFYWPGWLMLKLLTLGRYPPKRSEPHSKGFVGLFGFLVLLVGLLMTLPGGVR